MSSQAMSVPSFSSAAAATPSLLPAVKQREDGVTAAHSTEQHLDEVETPLAVAPAAEHSSNSPPPSSTPASGFPTSKAVPPISGNWGPASSNTGGAFMEPAAAPDFLDSIAQDVRGVAAAPLDLPSFIAADQEEQQHPQLVDDGPPPLVLESPSTTNLYQPVPPTSLPQRPGGRPVPAGKQRMMAVRAEREMTRAGRTCEQAREESAAKLAQLQLVRKIAAEKIQKSWREHRKQRESKKNLKDLQRISATMIQALFRGFSVRRKRNNKYATIIQKWVRAWLVRNRKRKAKSVTIIQRHYRGFIHRKVQLKQLLAAVRIQAVQRGKAERKFAEKHREDVEESTKKLQSQARAFQAKKVANAKRAERQLEQQTHNAARTVQATFRGHVARKRAESKRTIRDEELAVLHAVIKIQSMARRVQAKQVVAKLRIRRKNRFDNAATVVRKYWLAYIVRRRFLELKEEFRSHEPSVEIMQRYVRGYLVRLRLWRKVIRAEEEQWAVVEIQRCWRGFLGRLKWELAYEAAYSRDVAIRRLQRYVRGWLARTRVTRMRKRIARAEFQKARQRFKAAQKIQALVRSVQERGRIRAKRRYMSAAALRIQKVWRGSRLRCDLWRQITDRRIVRLQAVSRGFLVRRRRLHIIAKIILIQRAYRHWRRFIPGAERHRRRKNRHLRAKAVDMS
jgi:hypothetical protein